LTALFVEVPISIQLGLVRWLWPTEESVGVVRNATLKTLLESSAPQCIHRAPVFRCTICAPGAEVHGTSVMVPP